MLLQYGSQMCLPQVYYFAISLIEKPSIGLAGLSLEYDHNNSFTFLNFNRSAAKDKS